MRRAALPVWDTVIVQAFELLLPNPTKPEILRSYPLHLIRVFGHARIMMNLDASDVKGQTSRFSESQTACYSTYHPQTGAKLLAGCTPIGGLPAPWVPAAFPNVPRPVGKWQRRSLKTPHVGSVLLG